MTDYSVLDVTPTNDDWIPDYLPTANARVAAHGGNYIARMASHAQVEGDAQPSGLRIIIEWPSRAHAETLLADEAHAPHLLARPERATSHHYLIAGKDDLA